MKLLIFILFFSSSIFSQELKYKDKFVLKIKNGSFHFDDHIQKFDIDLKPCNEKILRSSFNYLEMKKPKINILNNSTPTITYLLDNNEIKISMGSKIHLNLENMSKLIVGNISRAHQACK